MLKAEVIKSGDSQMVRLPSELHLDVDSVYVNKMGSIVVLSTKEPWETFVEGLNEAEDFPEIERNAYWRP
jgi:virulence-associated protein VagC